MPDPIAENAILEVKILSPASRFDPGTLNQLQ
jgi:hypothetical protein